MLRKCAITLTLKPEHYRRNSYQLYYEAFNTAFDLLTDLADDWEFVIELTSKGIPHVHAWARMNKRFIGKLKTEKGYNIKFQNIVQKDYKVFGHCLLKWITDEPKWEEYMYKDMDTTTEVLMDSGYLLESMPIIRYNKGYHELWQNRYKPNQFNQRIDNYVNPLYS